MHKFTWGVGNRAASVRIPSAVAHKNGKGYIEDRRPSSNMDPYPVCAMIADTVLLKESLAAPLVEHMRVWSEWQKTQTFYGLV